MTDEEASAPTRQRRLHGLDFPWPCWHNTIEPAPDDDDDEDGEPSD